MDRIDKWYGIAFGRAYIQQMVKHHEENVGLCRTQRCGARHGCVPMTAVRASERETATANLLALYCQTLQYSKEVREISSIKAALKGFQAFPTGYRKR